MFFRRCPARWSPPENGADSSAKCWLWVANDSENRVASRLQVVTSLMEPVMILLLGGIVGFVVIAIILPIFEMSTLARLTMSETLNHTLLPLLHSR